MTNTNSVRPDASRFHPLAQFRTWHLIVLVMFAAIAIADIQNWGRTELPLVVLAGGGYALYGVVAWLVWSAIRRHEGRLGRLLTLGIYGTMMALLFLTATVVYLVLEFFYLSRQYWWH